MTLPPVPQRWKPSLTAYWKPLCKYVRKKMEKHSRKMLPTLPRSSFLGFWKGIY